MNTANPKPKRTYEELETAFEELAVHYDRTVARLERAERRLACQVQQYDQAISWLQDLRRAAGATGETTSHRDLCLLIADLRRLAFEDTPSQHPQEAH